MPECIDPMAPEVPCCICGRVIKTCESETPVDKENGIVYVCLEHPDGAQLSDGRWVCSDQCWVEAVGVDL